MSPFTLEQVDFDACRDEIGRLRARVWLGEGFLDPAFVKDGVWLDGDDDRALHWIARVDGEMVGAARLHVLERLEDAPYAEHLLPHEEDLPMPSAYLMRLVVAPEHRGVGIARAMDEARIEQALWSGCRSVFGIASSRVGSLAKLGFATTAIIPPCSPITKTGRLMVRRLP